MTGTGWGKHGRGGRSRHKLVQGDRANSALVLAWSAESRNRRGLRVVEVLHCLQNYGMDEDYDCSNGSILDTAGLEAVDGNGKGAFAKKQEHLYSLQVGNWQLCVGGNCCGQTDNGEPPGTGRKLVLGGMGRMMAKELCRKASVERRT